MSDSGPGLIVGVVTDDQGRPLAESVVCIQAAPTLVADIAGLTGPDGRFSLTAPVTGSYTVAASAPGFGVASVTVDVDVERRPLATDVELILTRLQALP